MLDQDRKNSFRTMFQMLTLKTAFAGLTLLSVQRVITSFKQGHGQP